MPFAIQWIENCSGIAQRLSIRTPAGHLQLTLMDDVICQVDWQSPSNLDNHGHPLALQLAAYWQNPHTSLPIKLLQQGSAYRQKVWAQMAKIPMGETLSYKGLAEQLGSGARAVGNACRDNPYPLFIPCHRVVSASGLGGYCGQTEGPMLAIKTRLLAFEEQYKQ
ncbi:methylated-DNA--[protein]-cysteine S-methyltransferase [Methylosoma difficile]